MTKELSQADLLALAIDIASSAHMMQKDKGGHPYILHPLKVMMRLAHTNDYELMQIAVLHDVIEDGEITTEYLLENKFSERVIHALILLTHDADETYEEYIEYISKNKDTCLVKLEDLKENSDITRLKGLREKDFERIAKYHKAYVFLKQALDNFK